MKMKPYYLLIIIFLLTIVTSKAAVDEEKKLLHHIMLFQWKDDIGRSDKTDLLDLFKGLPAKVEGFEKIEILDLTNSSNGYNIILILQFTSEEALKEYENHPDHLKITKTGPSLLSKFEVIDYWK